MTTAVIRPWLVALMVLALSGLPTRVFAACKIGRLAELPVTMTGLRPLVSAKINGADALFVADSGAFFGRSPTSQDISTSVACTLGQQATRPGHDRFRPGSQTQA